MAFYFLVLCFEIYIIAKNPLDNKHNKRANLYHILSQTIPFIMAILRLSIGDFHPINNGKYWLARGTTGGYITIVIVETNHIYSLILIIMSIKVIN